VYAIYDITDNKGQSVSRILYPSSNETDGHSSGPGFSVRFMQTTCPDRADDAGLLVFAPGGVYLAALIAQCTGGLLLHHFTLIPAIVGTVYFLLHLPFLLSTAGSSR